MEGREREMGRRMEREWGEGRKDGEGEEEGRKEGRKEGAGVGEGEGKKEGVEILSGWRMNTLLQELAADSSGQKLKPIIIGARDFNPSQIKGDKKEWRELEVIAARGPQGTPRENFQPSGVMMDQTTDNSHAPLCVVNGECYCTVIAV